LYRKQGRLSRVLSDARALIEKSRLESSAMSNKTTAGGDRDSEPAVPRLTAGGIITLERTLVKLEALQQAPAP